MSPVGLSRRVILRASLVATVLILAASASASAAAPRIVGGTSVPITDHPYQVRLTLNMAGGSFVCGGSIRDATHVLTAAHCVVDESLFYPAVLAPADVQVGYGNSDRNALTTVRVANISVEPRYLRDGSPRFDVAVLTLASAIDLVDPQPAPARAIPLASAAELETAFTAGVPGFATGWGDTAEGGSGSDLLQGADLPLRADAACEAEYSREYDGQLMLCAGGLGNAPSGNKDTCQGDSGGPLALDTDPSAATTYELVGITNFGNGCGRQSTPGAYAWVQSAELRPFLERASPVGPPSPPASNPTISGTLRVGSTITCTAPSVAGASPSRYFWVVVEGGSFTVTAETSAPTYQLPAELAGASLVCDARYEGAGGFSFSDTPAGASVGPVLPALAASTPPAMDSTRPRARVSRVRCLRRRCTVKVTASDVGGLVRSLSAKLAFKVKRCRTVGGRRRCRVVKRTKTLRPKKVRAGFTMTTTLKRGRYKVTVVATDTSGNRSGPSGKSFRVR